MRPSKQPYIESHVHLAPEAGMVDLDHAQELSRADEGIQMPPYLIQRFRKYDQPFYRARAVVDIFEVLATLNTPYQKLYFAVLCNAINDLVRRKQSTVQDRVDAIQYFMTGRFVMAANTCDLDPDYVLDTLVSFKILKKRPLLDGAAHVRKQ